MKPMVHGLEEAYWGQIDFVYIDRENAFNRSAVDRFGITTQPIFIVVDSSGNELERWFGFKDEAGIREVLDKYVGG
jgi:thioredoxin-like negative regulator of GroEL